MNLKLAIIHLDFVVETLDLEPGSYSLGRGSHNNIVVQHFSLKPDQGRVFYEDGQWYYEDAEDKQKQLISETDIMAISHEISLTTQNYVESGAVTFGSVTEAQSLRQQKVKYRPFIVASSVAALLVAIVLGYLTVRHVPEQFQQSNLIDRVRDKIVEFEIAPNSQSIEDLKKYAGLTDKDFKETSGFCTGFLISPNVVLTAAHCLMGRMVIDINNDFYIKTSDGKKHQISRVMGFDVKRDFLFLETEGMEDYGHLNLAENYGIEQKVFTVGNVHGEGIAIRDGILSSETVDSDDPTVSFLRYSAGTSPGNSGGPLLDENGDVVALVFASTSTENFNLGTPAKYLQGALKKFVTERQESQVVQLQMNRVLNFKPTPMLQALSIPHLPHYEEYPEVVQAFKEVTIDVTVPLDFSQVDELILSAINKKVIETFQLVQTSLREKNEIVLDWKSFVSKQTPAILPSQFDGSQSVFTKISDRYYPQVAGLIDSPTKADYIKYKKQLEKEGKFDFQAYGYNIEVSPEKIDLLESDVFYKPKNESGSKERLQNLSFGAPYSQLLVYSNKDLRRDGFFGIKLFLKNFLGQEGVISSAFSRFLRPAAMKDFTIKKLEFANEDIKVDEVTDRLGRPWVRNWVEAFEAVHLITYCTELPEGTFCIGRVLNVYNDFLLKTIEENFREFVLSHLLINPYFWEKEALVRYVESGKSKNFPLMNGVSLSLQKNKMIGRLSQFPVEFTIPNAKKVESLRIQTGLLQAADNAEWTGYGLQWVQREKMKDMLCGAGVEVFNSQSSFILNYLRDRKKQEKLRKIKGEDPKPLPGVWYKPYRGLKTPFQVFGYCAPLEEDPRVTNQYFVDFKNAKPFKLKHKITN